MALGLGRHAGRWVLGKQARVGDTRLGKQLTNALRACPRAQAASGTDPGCQAGAARLRRELELQRGLRHPHVVRLLAAAERGGSTYLVMEACSERPADAGRFECTSRSSFRSGQAALLSHRRVAAGPWALGSHLCTLSLNLMTACTHPRPHAPGGATLGDVLRHLGPLSEAQAARVLRQAAGALQYLHARGICHGDVKPAK